MIVGILLVLLGFALCVGYIYGLANMLTTDTWLRGSFIRTLAIFFGIIISWYVGFTLVVVGFTLIFA